MAAPASSVHLLLIRNPQEVYPPWRAIPNPQSLTAHLSTNGGQNLTKNSARTVSERAKNFPYNARDYP